VRIWLLAVGRLKQGPERDLAERYRKRFEDSGRPIGFRGLVIKEIAESRARDAGSRIAEEGAALAAAIPDRAIIVALDERGVTLDSASFARNLAKDRDAGLSDLVFLIGGADGLSPELRSKARQTLAFGSATWPHQLARIMLLEQLYRAATLLAGHPYHRV
jgi:23S rRNA (pseudouridine1915-N3)-methyltransferase